MSNKKPTNGWDALIKIVEMILVTIAFILLTPFGWFGLIFIGLMMCGHSPE